MPARSVSSLSQSGALAAAILAIASSAACQRVEERSESTASYLSQLTPPQSVTIYPQTPSQVIVKWTPASAGSSEVGSSAVAEQRVYRDGTLIATVSGSDSWILDSGLAPSSTHTYHVIATSASGEVSAPSNTASVTTASLCTSTSRCGIWSDPTAASSQPGSWMVYNELDPTEVELGVAFRSDIAGQIDGIKINFQHADGYPRKVSLWRANGQLLKTAWSAPQDGTHYGFTDVLFDEPMPIQAGATYIASYHEVGGVPAFYPVTENFFSLGALDNPPIHVEQDGAGGQANGLYQYGPSAFPTETYRSSNYWVDIIFTRPTAFCGGTEAPNPCLAHEVCDPVTRTCRL